MGKHPALGDGHFAPGDPLKNGHSLLKKLEAFYINEIGAGQAMLGDKDRLLVPFQIGQEFRGIALEGRDEFSTHEVIL